MVCQHLFGRYCGAQLQNCHLTLQGSAFLLLNPALISSILSWGCKRAVGAAQARPCPTAWPRSSGTCTNKLAPPRSVGNLAQVEDYLFLRGLGERRAWVQSSTGRCRQRAPLRPRCCTRNSPRCPRRMSSCRQRGLDTQRGERVTKSQTCADRRRAGHSRVGAVVKAPPERNRKGRSPREPLATASP